MDWEDMYMRSAPETLPWNAGGPDADLVRLVESGRIPGPHVSVEHSAVLPGRQALDLGVGPGHDAVYLIQKGFDVIAIDISPSAIQLARENASQHGLFAFFQVGDIRAIPVEDHWVDFTNDRGCFHLLEGADQEKAAAEIARVMKPRGLFLLRVFREKKNLQSLFENAFKILESWDGTFAGPGQRLSYSMLMEKR
jgi:SAM-dependent methyltransferase